MPRSSCAPALYEIRFVVSLATTSDSPDGALITPFDFPLAFLRCIFTSERVSVGQWLNPSPLTSRHDGTAVAACLLPRLCFTLTRPFALHRALRKWPLRRLPSDSGFSAGFRGDKVARSYCDIDRHHVAHCLVIKTTDYPLPWRNSRTISMHRGCPMAYLGRPVL